MKRILIALIAFYQIFLSPLLHVLTGGVSRCRYEVTCSEFAKQSLKNYGIIRGSRIALRRFLSCRPNAKPYGINL